MNINYDYVFFSLSPDETIKLGRYVGRKVLSGISVMLNGDLGSGKTTFVKGFVDGLGIKNSEYVNSPTYNLMNHYFGRVEICHIDLYRLKKFSDLIDIGVTEIFNSDIVTIIEWADKIKYDFYPKKYLNITFNIEKKFKRSIYLKFCGFCLI